jgi:tetratricopeptide (TPR) repeat protein
VLHPRSYCLLVALALAVVTTAAHAEEDPIERAKVLFEQGGEAYRAGQFAKAIELLEEAHRLSNEPVLLFNLAKAHEGKGDLIAAVDAYERYLRDAKDIPDRKAIEGRVDTLRAQIAGNEALRKRAEEERRKREQAERDAEKSPSPVPWVIAGVGAAGLTVGGVLAALAQEKEDEVPDSESQLAAADTIEEGERFALGANVSFAVGGALLAAGVVWGVVDVTVLSAPEPAVSVRLGPSGIAIAGSF